MSLLKLLKSSFAAAASTAVIATALVATPASADTAIILPPDANGVNNSGILTYACPNHVEVFAPMPTNTVDPLSNVETAQLGTFRWQLNYESSEVDTTDSDWDGFVSSHTMVYRPDTELNPGDTVDLNLTASIYDGPVAYTSESIDFTVTVVDPTFAQGSGTIQDPYIVTSAADMQKMRCYEFKHFRLANDINLTGVWFPIGNNGENWNGHFDGANHTISGLNTGHVSMEQAGLFGNVAHSSIKNLKIVNPVAKGIWRSGILVGSARYGVTISNIEISGAVFEGNRTAGLLAGHKDYGGLVSDVSVEGQIIIRPAIARYYQPWSSQTLVGRNYTDDIGGLVGFEDGDGAVYLRNEVDVDIDVLASVNFVEFAAVNSYQIESQGTIYEIGGLFGETDEDSTFDYNKVTSDIYIEAYGSVGRIGGAFGGPESPASNMEIDSKIHIVSLGTAGNDEFEIREIGGATGYSDDQTIRYSNVKSEILIEAANGSNNSVGADFTDNSLSVKEVGGMGGEWDDDTSDMFTRVKTEIEIRGVDVIESIGGFVGLFDDDNSMGYTDNFVSGSIKLNAESSITGVGGFSNIRNSGAIAGERLFSAVTIETSGTATVSNSYPFLGENDTPVRQMAAFSYWDASLNPDSNPAGYPALPATTSQLKNSAFLKATGMDLDNVWQLESGKYPELREGVYTWGFAGSSEGNTIIVSGPEVLVPRDVNMPEKAKSNSRVFVTGAFLNTVTDVTLDGVRIDYIVKADGTLAFDVPALGVGKYQVTFRGQKSGSVVYKQLEVTPNIVVKAVKGQVRIKATGLLGKTISWKVAGKSESKFVNNNITLIKVPTTVAGKNVRVTITIDGVKYSSQIVQTK